MGRIHTPYGFILGGFCLGGFAKAHETSPRGVWFSGFHKCLFGVLRRSSGISFWKNLSLFLEGFVRLPGNFHFEGFFRVYLT